MAPILSVLFTPLIYLLLLYARYEDLFVWLIMGPEKDWAVKWYAKWRLIRHLGLNVYKVSTFIRTHATDLMKIKSMDEVDRILATKEPDLNS